MSAVDFPDSPEESDEFSANGVVFIYQNGAWIRSSQTSTPVSRLVAKSKGSLITASGSATPVNISPGANGSGIISDQSETEGLAWSALPAESASSLSAIGDVTTSVTLAPGGVVRWGGSGWSQDNSLFSGFIITKKVFSNYTLETTDVGTLIAGDAASTISITVPPNSTHPIPVGSFIFVSRDNTGLVQVAQGSGVTINGRTKLRSEHSFAMLLKRGTDAWVFLGDTMD